MTLDINYLKDKYNLATPMMKQYLDIKFAHQDCLLLFRMGDFYELFFEDAVIASDVLGLVLTKRGKIGDQDILMCGVPHHAFEGYLNKLIKAGKKVAICDQLETPEEAKKRGYKAVVLRDVIRIVTPGTIIEENLVDSSLPNYLISVVFDKDLVGIACIDITTFEFLYFDADIKNYISEINKLSPKEIIVNDSVDDEIKSSLRPFLSKITYQPSNYFVLSRCKEIAEDFYGNANYQFLKDLTNTQMLAIGSILEYLKITQKCNLLSVPLPKLVSNCGSMYIDSATRRNLEISSTIFGEYKGSLLSVINKTLTSGGSRLLYKYVVNPLIDKERIEQRQELVRFFLSNWEITTGVRNILKNTTDLERHVSKINVNKALPRDLLGIKQVLINIIEICEIIGIEKVDNLFKDLSCCDYVVDLISKSINSDSIANLNDGGYIKHSYHPKIEELYNLINNSKNIISDLKMKYRLETGIDTLKINHNNMLGFFIDVTPKQSEKIVDSKFIHRQTTANSVRFITEKLKRTEDDIVNAKLLVVNLEKEMFSKICNEILKYSSQLMDIAYVISRIDVFTSLAYIAKEFNYVMPEITNNKDHVVKDGRHVVVEQHIKQFNFMKNDCNLSKDQYLWLITGPNMAGKSTFLRQNAIMIILAQIGSFVPASYAKIGIVDKLFSRVGAGDDLSRGQSTFMVEMIETSNIISQATERSFIILDEIGRGTSTYDGLSIAWACIEYVHNVIKARTLFATHYHELTALSDSLVHLQNYNTAVEEDGHRVLFLYKIISGIASKSYGINVAEIAGLPKVIVGRAKQILQHLEE